MSQTTPSHAPHRIEYPAGYRARRGLNWGTIGLTYASFYLCRYNLSFASKSLIDEYGFTKDQFGLVLTAFFWAYAVGQMVNGLLADRFGGKRSMALGVFSTVLLNWAFGAASFWGMLSAFTLIWMVNGYMQSFGAPGMVKMNTAWFRRDERGSFAGIFGMMIQCGRFGINMLAPALLGGFTFLLWTVEPMHWRYLFYVPSVVALVFGFLLILLVKETPRGAGYEFETGDEDGESEAPPTIGEAFRTIFSNRYVWIVAGAYACTGVVRQGIDQWFPLYLQEQFQINMKSTEFAWAAWGIPLVAVAGSWTAGIVSDRWFAGRRAPVAAALYFVESVIILAAAYYANSPGLATMFLILISFTANSTHSILGTAAAMDIGGRRMAGTAAGLIDSFQYYGGGLAGVFLGAIIQRAGWQYWFFSMCGFGLIGCALMLSIRKATHFRTAASTAKK